MDEKETRVSEETRGGSRRREFLKGAGKLTGSAAVLGMSGLAAGCGGSDSGEGAAATAGGKASLRGATISFWTMPYPVDPQKWLEFRKKTAADFKAKTGITVEWTSLVAQSFIQKWSLAMAKGNPPDVGDMFYLQSRVLQGKGKWGPLDLTDRIDGGEFGDWNRFPAVAQRESEYDGKTYGIPWRIAAFPMVYNSALLPKPPKTIAELEQMGVQLVSSKGLKSAATTWGQPYFQLDTVGAMWGVQPLTEDLKGSAFDDPRWLEALTWLQDMIDKRVLLKDAGIDPATGVSFDNVLRNQVGASIDCDSSIRASAESSAPQMVAKLKSAPTPIGPAGVSRSLASCAQFSVMQNSKNVEAGIEWIKYLLTPEVNADMNRITGQTPVDPTVQKMLTDDFIQPFYDATKNAFHITVPTPAWDELTAPPSGPILALTTAVFAGRDVKESLAAAHSKTNEILAKYP